MKIASACGCESAAVKLVLSEEQAITLFMICCRIGGPAATTRRVYADEIVHALRDAGIGSSDFNHYGSIVFT